MTETLHRGQNRLLGGPERNTSLKLRTRTEIQEGTALRRHGGSAVATVLSLIQFAESRETDNRDRDQVERNPSQLRFMSLFATTNQRDARLRSATFCVLHPPLTRDSEIWLRRG